MLLFLLATYTNYLLLATCLLLASGYLLLTTCYILFDICYLPFVVCFLIFDIYYLLLVTCYLLLATYSLLLTACDSQLLLYSKVGITSASYSLKALFAPSRQDIPGVFINWRISSALPLSFLILALIVAVIFFLHPFSRTPNIVLVYYVKF